MPAVVIGGVDHYAVQLIVLGSPRPSGRPIDVTKVDGSALVVRDLATSAPFVPITLTGDLAGVSQVFLSPEPEGLASCDGGLPTRWSTSQYAEMLAAAQAAAASAATAAASLGDVGTAVTTANSAYDLAVSASSQVDTLRAEFDTLSGSVGGGSSRPVIVTTEAAANSQPSGTLVAVEADLAP